ncbi:MAG: ABC transporter permease [Frankia sp.]|nr:ABC transporter permease [Frankia sp.]
MQTLRAEWVKLRSEPGLVVSAVALFVATAGMALLSLSRAEAPACPPEFPGCELPVVDVVRLTLSGVYPGQIFAVVLATLTVADEYETGLIVTTLVGSPRRLRVVAGKAIVATGVVGLAGAAAVAASVLAGRLILPGRGFTTAAGYPPLSATDPTVLRAAGGTALYLVLVALLACGVAFTLRDTTASLVTVLGLLFVLPLAGAWLNHETLSEWTQRYAPMPAGLSIQTTVGPADLPISGWAGLGVLALWAAAAVVSGGASVTLRDA